MRAKGDKQGLEFLVARVAARQHGVVSAAQLRSAGFSSSGIDRRIESARLHRIHRGVYAVGHTRLSDEGRWIAAVLACGLDAVLSHRSAAALWGIRRPRDGPVDVTIPGTAGRKARAGISIHRSTTLIASCCTRHAGIPVTTTARTLADLRPILSPAQFASAVREAEFRHLPTGDQHPGEGTMSELETRMLTLFRRHRLPQPEVNASIDRYVVDFLWTDQRLIAEVDGWMAHRTRSAFEEDRARDARLSVLGYRVLRFTWGQVTDDAARVARTVRSLLRART